MARLIYMTIASLDGYTADEHGTFDWAAPDEEVLAVVNDVLRPVETHLYGRRMYDVLLYWETAGSRSDLSPGSRDFAQIWRAADKVVYSRTLEHAASARTRIERSFDAQTVARMKKESRRDLSIGGPELASQAMRAGLVDEWNLFVAPVLVGNGTRSLPEHARVKLELLDERRFRGGMVYLRYGLAADRA